MGVRESLAQISVDLDSAARRCRAGATRDEVAGAIEKIASDFGMTLEILSKSLKETSEPETEANAGNQASRVDQNQTPTVPKRRRSTPESSAAFAEFWRAYPRKVGKGAALRAWAKMGHSGEQDQLAKCLDALKWQRYSRDWKKDNGAFIPHPATYLNEQRYLDEPPEAFRDHDDEAQPPAKRTPPPRIDQAQREKVGNVLREFTKGLATPPSAEQEMAKEEVTRRKLAEQAKQMGVR